MKRFVIYQFLSLILSLQVFHSAFAQNGHNYLKNYTPNIGKIDKRISGITQDTNGVMYYTTTRGVMTYDGASWGLIKTPSTPLCISSNSNKEILYVGCEGDFGYLTTNEKGYHRYYSLGNSDIQIGRITKIIVLEEDIYYYSDETIFLYSQETKSIEKIWNSKKKNHYQGIFSFNEKIYVNRKGKGLFNLTDGKLTPIKNGEKMVNYQILAAIPLNSKNIILYTNSSEGFIYDGIQFKKQKNDIINYIKENTITCALSLCDNKYIIGTLTGGCMIIDKETNKIVSMINYQTGLSDDESYSLGEDNCGGIWIAHELGLSRLDLKLPIKQYSSYPGVEGYIISSKVLNNKNYVATNQGLYILSELSIDEKIVYAKGIKKSKYSPPVVTNTISTPVLHNTIESIEKEEIIEETKTKNKIFKNLFKQKNKEKKKKKKKKRKESNSNKNGFIFLKNGFYTPQELPTTTCIPCEPCDKRPAASYYVQHSVIHGYKKVIGIDDKCKDMVLFNGTILAISNTTLFKVNKDKAKIIIENKIMNTIYVPKEVKNVYYVGTSKGIFARNQYKELWSLENIYASVHSILHDDDNGNLWLGCEKSVMKIEIDDNGFPGRQTTYPLNIGFSEKIIVRNIFGEIYFFSSDKVFLFSEANNDIIEIENLQGIEINDFFRIINSNDGYTWVNNGSGWVGLPESSNKETKIISYFNALNNVQYIYLDDSSKIWVTDVNNNLYRMNINQEYPYKSHSILTIRSVNGSKNKLFSVFDVLLRHDHSGIEFNFSTPYFLNEQNIEYQYLLDGEMENWSEWSTNSFVYFPFVPIGDYILKVRSRNVFGEMSNIAEVPLVVSPPYWLTWWFYIIEISVIFFLLLLSILLNTKKEESWISRSLMLLTVIIVFKLLQAISHAYIHTTPVMDFIISVIMVFVILKVEKLAVKGLIRICRNLKAIWIKKQKPTSGTKENFSKIKDQLKDELLKYSEPKSFNNN